MLPVGLEPTILPSERPQTHALGRAAIGIGTTFSKLKDNKIRFWFRSKSTTYFNILVTDQLNAQILVFITSLLYASTCFKHYCAHHQEVKIVLYSIGYRHTYRWRPVRRLRGFSLNLRSGRPPTECDDT